MNTLKNDPKYLINFIKIVELLSPYKKRKYTETTLRILKHSQQFTKSRKLVSNILSEEKSIQIDDNEFSDTELLFADLFLSYIIGSESLKTIMDFYQLNEQNLIKNNDLSTYITMEQIEQEVHETRLREEEKRLEKSILKIYEDDTWLILRPLTYESSLKYGSHTKWCTASKYSESSFYDYASSGVLIYCINKKSNISEKYAIYRRIKKSNNETTVWNNFDRNIDTLDTGIPIEVLSSIMDELKRLTSNVVAEENDFSELPF
jgi:hypothetical protein